MARKERTYLGIIGLLQRLLMALEANKSELPHLEGFRTKLAAMLSQILDLSHQQSSLRASKQEASKQLRQLTEDGQKLASVVFAAVKEHYGNREEKIAEFGLQPFRGRKVKPEQEEPELPELPLPAQPAQ